MSATQVKQAIAEFSHLAETETWTRRDTRLEDMETLYTQLDPASREAIVLCFALAKVYDDLDEVDRCFQALSTGNHYHRKGKTDTIDDARQTIRAIRYLFDTQTVATLNEPAPVQPLFIIGMPRSGTTLVEQILSSHPRVSAGGELKMMGQWSYGFLKLYTSNPAHITLNHYLHQLREHYVTQSRELRLDGIFTDKMPVNFLWTGFIRTAFPSAPIIHTVRDPMAVCWSLFKTDFAGSSNGYACDLRDIGEFYRLYTELMQYWEANSPGAVYRLNYERLTQDQETETRRLLEVCGLDWNNACLDFQNNPRDAGTASRYQVKRPLYQGSSENWKRYEKYLEPLKESLGPVYQPSPGK